MKKKIIIFPTILLAFATLLVFQACDEDLPSNYAFDPYEFASLDEMEVTGYQIF